MRRSITLALVLFVSVIAFGCENEYRERQDPMTGRPLARKALNPYWDPMSHNAASYDMSVTEHHFVPHTTELNGLGMARLDQLIPILDQYGGLVRFGTFSKDSDEINARMETIRVYLTDAGVDMSNVTVASMLAGGRGVRAKQAVQTAGGDKERYRSNEGGSEG